MASATADPRIKNLKIKTGVVKRLDKEKKMYEKEAEAEEAKLTKMKNEGKDEYDVRKQREILDESRNMIPDCKRRLDMAYADLKSILDAAEDLKETEEYTAAKTQLDSVTL